MQHNNTRGRVHAGPSFQLGHFPLVYIDDWFSQRAGFLQQQKTSALGKPDVDLFMARTDSHDLPTTNRQPK